MQKSLKAAVNGEKVQKRAKSGSKREKKGQKHRKVAVNGEKVQKKAKCGSKRGKCVKKS